MTLHEAIELVLKKNKGAMTAKEIAEQINKEDLYQREDRLPVPLSQIYAHIKNYPSIFEKMENEISLIENTYSDDFIEFIKHTDDKEKTIASIVDIPFENVLQKIENKLKHLYGLNDLESLLFTVEIAVIIKKIYVSKKIKTYKKFPSVNELIGFTIEFNKNIKTKNHFSTILRYKNLFKNDSFYEYLEDQLKWRLHESPLEYLKSSRFFEKTSSGYFITPSFINSILLQLAKPKEDEIVFDPAAGRCDTLVDISKLDFNVFLYGQEINSNLAELGRLNLLLNGSINYEISDSDSILKPSIEKHKADIIISNPPFGGSYHESNKIDFERICNDNSLEIVFFEMMLSRLNPETGRMAVVVPDGFLYKRSNKILRKVITKIDILDAIISLPNGAFIPYSNVKTSVIVINYKKPKNRKGKVLFINGETSVNFQYHQREVEVDESKLNLLVSDISKVYHDSIKSSSIVSHRLISNETIVNQDYDLSSKKYTSGVLELIEKVGKREILQELSEILTRTSLVPANEFNKDTKYVEIKDLNEKYVNFYLNQKGLNEKKIFPSSFKMVNNSCLLLARVGNRIKPTYFEYKGEEIVINNNIIAFDVNIEVVNIEYLISQLNSGFFLSQLELIQQGTTIPTIQVYSLLKLKVPIPFLSDQYNRLAFFKEQQANSFKVTQFIKDIKLVSNIEEIKGEVERFASITLKDSNFIEYKREFEFEKFPFTEKEIAETRYIKHSKDKLYWYLLLIDDKKRISGVLTIQSENEISFEDYSNINAYANFILNASSIYIQKNTNRLLNEFSHTTKNILNDINKILKDFLNTKNKNLLKSLNTELLKDEELINHLIETEGRTREDFLAINRMKDAKKIVNSHFKLFKRRHQYYTSSVNSKFENIKLSEFVNRIKNRNSIFFINNSIEDEILFIKSAPIELAFADLIDNAIKYSKNKKVLIEMNPKDLYVEFIITNKIDTVLAKDNYERLGKENIKKDDGTYSTGLSYAYRSINENNDISIASYNFYKGEKIFKINIKLKKK